MIHLNNVPKDEDILGAKRGRVFSLEPFTPGHQLLVAAANSFYVRIAASSDGVG